MVFTRRCLAVHLAAGIAALIAPTAMVGLDALAAEPSTLLAQKARDGEALLDAAGKTGAVPVIITLARPETGQTIAAGDDDALKASIKALVDPFVAEVLRPAGASAKSAAAAPIKTMPFLPMVATFLSRADLERVAASPVVARIDRDGVNAPTLTQSVPLIGGIEAATAGATGAGKTIAILDTGVQYSHPFVAGRIAGSACRSSNTIITTSLCPGGHDTEYGGNSGINCTGWTECAHGTHVAGIAAGSRPRGTPPRGVAPAARLFPIQVFSNFEGRLLAWDSDIVAALQDVYQQRVPLSIVAANLSLGGGSYTAYCNDTPLAQAIQQLRDVGVATVVASGNDASTSAVSSPGCVQAAVTVGSSTKANQISWFSNMAPMVDLMAPGSAITSSVPTNLYASYNGTSMATPHVAGAFAALKSVATWATVDEIQYALKSTGVAIVDNRLGGVTTRPRININLALRRLLQPPANDAFARAVTIPMQRSTPITVSGLNARATLQTGERRGSTLVQATVWWKFIPVESGRFVIKTAGSSFNTTLGIYVGSAVNRLTQLAFNDDAVGGRSSSVSVSLVGGRTYYIQVGGSGGARGRISLTITPPLPANDNFVNAVAFTPSDASQTFRGFNGTATLEAGEPVYMSAIRKTVWWKFVPTATVMRTIDTFGSDFDTTLAIYRGTSLDGLFLVGSSNDINGTLQSAVYARFAAGQTYYVQVGGFEGAGGAVRLNIEP